MRPDEMRAAFERLGWSQNTAAMRLAEHSAPRVNDWLKGRRKIPPRVALLVRLWERLELGPDLVPLAVQSPAEAVLRAIGRAPPLPGKPRATLRDLREEGHKLFRRAVRKRKGSQRHLVWFGVCECGWVSAKSPRKIDILPMHVEHLRQTRAAIESG